MINTAARAIETSGLGHVQLGCYGGLVGANPSLQRALRIVHDSYASEEFSLRSISLQIRVSERHIARLFKSNLGSTFVEYVRELRLQRACQLLESSELAVKAIAAMVGYRDTSHFIRCFRRATGSTPADFRKR